MWLEGDVPRGGGMVGVVGNKATPHRRVTLGAVPRVAKKKKKRERYVRAIEP